MEAPAPTAAVAPPMRIEWPENVPFRPTAAAARATRELMAACDSGRPVTVTKRASDAGPRAASAGRTAIQRRSSATGHAGPPVASMGKSRPAPSWSVLDRRTHSAVDPSGSRRTSLIASALGHHPAEFYRLDDDTDRQPVKVDLSA